MQPNDPQWDTVWHVHETTEQRRGDIVLVKGAHAMALDLPVGPDKANKGIRNDQHDAIGVELRLYPRGVRALALRAACCRILPFKYATISHIVVSFLYGDE